MKKVGKLEYKWSMICIYFYLYYSCLSKGRRTEDALRIMRQVNAKQSSRFKNIPPYTFNWYVSASSVLTDYACKQRLLYFRLHSSEYTQPTRLENTPDASFVKCESTLCNIICFISVYIREYTQPMIRPTHISDRCASTLTMIIDYVFHRYIILCHNIL